MNKKSAASYTLERGVSGCRLLPSFITEPMVKSGGKGRRHVLVGEASPSNIGVSPSNLGVSPSNIWRNLSSTPRLIKQGWILAATILATAAAAQGVEGLGPAAITEGASKLDEDGVPGSVPWQGGRAGGSAQDVGDARRLQAIGAPDPCIENPMWGKEVDPSSYEFGCKEIEDMLDGTKTLVGNGQVRDVYLVEYGGKVVVLKVLQEEENPRKREKIFKMHQREALSLDAVRGHPNIVGMLGICNTTLVTEYYATSLDKVVWVNRETFTIRKVASMALDAARGLQALHEASIAPIVHFDMKPRQLLLDEGGRVMINDFNAAQFMGARGSGLPCPFARDGACRVVAWRSPENIAGKPMTEKVDIYSMGMIFFSLISGHVAFPMTEAGSRMILRGERPDIDPSWHTGYMQVVQGMWQYEPTERPSARQVVARLEGILDSLPTEDIGTAQNEGNLLG